jgi:hypothetical protein
MTAYPHPHHVPNPDDAGRPGMVRAIGAVGLMLGSLGVVAAPFLAMKLVGSANSVNLFLKSPQAPWMIASTVASCGLSVLLIIAATGCLQLRRWGRRLMIIYSIAALVVAIGGGYFYLRWLGIVGHTPAGQRGVAAWLQLTGWIFSLLYAIWALYGMTRPHAREAFESGAPIDET